MDNVKALFFDVGGTVFDWKNTARANIETLAAAHDAAIDGDAFAHDWRRTMFAIHTEVRQGNLPWLNADEMHLRALDEMTPRYPLLHRIDREEFVTATWHHLQAFPDAAQAIARLRRKFTVVVLTILNWQSVVSSSKIAGVQWDGILSCEFLGYYKPSLEAYRKGVALLGLRPDEAMMVAAHEGDLAAAQTAGLHTAYVKVPEPDSAAAGFGEGKEATFDIVAENFDALCEQLQV